MSGARGAVQTVSTYEHGGKANAEKKLVSIVFI
jgi:hypothetical protein